jgi:hypothetical protein
VKSDAGSEDKSDTGAAKGKTKTRKARTRGPKPAAAAAPEEVKAAPEAKKEEAKAEPEKKKEETKAEPEEKKEEAKAEPEEKKEEAKAEPEEKKKEAKAEPEEKKKEAKAEKKKEPKAAKKEPAHTPAKAGAPMSPSLAAPANTGPGNRRALFVILVLAAAVITTFKLTAGEEEHGVHVLAHDAGEGVPKHQAAVAAVPAPAPTQNAAPGPEAGLDGPGEGAPSPAEGEGEGAAPAEGGEPAEGEADAAPEGEGEGEEEAAPAPSGAGEIIGQGDPRAVPEGTKPKHARAFKRVPANADDKAPIGGVGETGIHVDRIKVGDTSAKRVCSGKSDGFSIANAETVHICFRVVHTREIEELSIVFAQDGKTKRRSKEEVPDKHAHSIRTRLKARDGMAGSWTASVKSADGTELAKIGFNVVE